MRPINGEVLAPNRSEEGSAVVEFVFLAVLLMIPVLYLILTLCALQSAAFGAAGAADQAAKVFAQAGGAEAGQRAAEQAVSIALADLGLDENAATLTITCGQAGCQGAGTTVNAVVALDVPLPLVPGLPGVNTSAATVHSEASAVIGRFR